MNRQPTRAILVMCVLLVGCQSSTDSRSEGSGADDGGAQDGSASDTAGSDGPAPDVDAADGGAPDVAVLDGGDGGDAPDADVLSVSVTRHLDGNPSAYSLTFDDNQWSQIDIVVPLLESYGYHATFFLVVGRVCDNDDPYCYSPTWADWQQVHDAGHEIGNHSLTHWFEDPDVTLEENIVGAADILTDNLAPPLTFAYPGSARDGTPEEIAAMDDLVLSRHIGFRRGNDASAGIVDRNYVNFGEGCESDMNGVFDDLLAHVPSDKLGSAPTTWLIGLWHGVDEAYCPVTKAEFEDHLAYVAAHDDEVWIASFADVLRYEMQRDATEIVVEESTDESVTFTASYDLDERFDLPLTFAVDPVGPAISSATAAWVGSGETVETRIDGGRILFTVRPKAEALRITWQ